MRRGRWAVPSCVRGCIRNPHEFFGKEVSVFCEDGDRGELVGGSGNSSRLGGSCGSDAKRIARRGVVD